MVSICIVYVVRCVGGSIIPCLNVKHKHNHYILKKSWYINTTKIYKTQSWYKLLDFM